MLTTRIQNLPEPLARAQAAYHDGTARLLKEADLSTLKRIAGAFVGLFVDDGSLAIWIALILAATAFVASTPWCDDRSVGAGFVVAVVAALLANVRRAAR